MAAPDMRIAGDDFFDGGNLYDISVMSTLGLDDESLELLSDVQGVKAVMPSYRVDAMVQVGESSYASVVESIPLQAARVSDSSDGAHVVSEDDGYLNRPILLEGTWPSVIGECVVGAHAAAERGIEPGTTITVQKASVDLDDAFAVRSFTVTGLVNSPNYASSAQLGSTSLGTGTVELYLYVPEEAFAKGLPYTVGYLTVDDALAKQWDSAAYDDVVEETQARVRAVSGRLADARRDAVLGDAVEQLEDAREQLATARTDTETQLSNAEKELDDARSQLDSAWSQLQRAKTQLDNTAAQIATTEAQLDAAEKQYLADQAQLETWQTEFAERGAQLNSLKSQQLQLQAQVNQAQSFVAVLERHLAQAVALGLPVQLAQQIEASLQSLADSLVEQPRSQLERVEAEIASIEAEKDQLETRRSELKKTRSRLDAQHTQLQQMRTQYDSGLAQYESGLAEYRNGEASYAAGLAEYESGKAQAESGFADAEAQIAAGQADIDAVSDVDVYVTNRTKNYGAASLSSDADGITQIATFLPFMFFLVAALVSLTSMTRMVDEERMTIGTHKALGYSKARITSKYLIYAVLASGVGSVLGVVLLGKMLPWFIVSSYQVSYAIPEVLTPVDPGIAAWAIGLSVGITAAATWGAVAASLRERPSALMLPRVPKAGKRIFLERIRPLWQHMSFSQKVAARNLLRYKRRFFMAVVGIAGCTALLMVGFGLRDAIGGIVANQYEVLMNYDAVVRVEDDMQADARGQVAEVLKSDAVDACLDVDDFTLIAEGPSGNMRIEVVVPKDPDALTDFVTLRDRASGEPLELSESQIVITEKAATTLGLHAGDTVKLYDENTVGDPTGAGRVFTVGGVAENYLGHYAYLMPEGFRAAFGEEPSYNQTYVQLSDSADQNHFSDQLLSIEGVNTVSFMADKIVTYEDMLDIMNKLIYLIMLLSAALAFVVLYNLTNINIDERIREIATLKVLGFTRREVYAYIFREVMVMSLVGALVGCVLGVPLTLYIAEAAETAQMMFGRSIEPLSFVLAFVITMIFSVIVALTMRGKLVRVDMVESLKSVE